jgi:hypothetical protein
MTWNRGTCRTSFLSLANCADTGHKISPCRTNKRSFTVFPMTWLVQLFCKYQQGRAPVYRLMPGSLLHVDRSSLGCDRCQFPSSKRWYGNRLTASRASGCSGITCFSVQPARLAHFDIAVSPCNVSLSGHAGIVQIHKRLIHGVQSTSIVRFGMHDER